MPIWLELGQLPVEAAGSGHSFTDGINPTRPAGSTVCTLEMFWLPSARARLNVKFVNAPALLVDWAVDWLSEKGIVAGQPVAANGVAGVNGAPPV